MLLEMSTDNCFWRLRAIFDLSHELGTLPLTRFSSVRPKASGLRYVPRSGSGLSCSALNRCFNIAASDRTPVTCHDTSTFGAFVLITKRLCLTFWRTMACANFR